ncbi:platelet-derived growth factor receptor-like protein [Macaca nemestrina]|uniref:platelet-derived growth factor receptor-like protein n=1 Tax=Macaca nemestrina TaxID=9545 RepID=UPI0039B8F699
MRRRMKTKDPSCSPKPTIQASATSVQLGENFSVTYVVLGEPEIAVDFSWGYPGQKDKVYRTIPRRPLIHLGHLEQSSETSPQGADTRTII